MNRDGACRGGLHLGDDVRRAARGIVTPLTDPWLANDTATLTGLGVAPLRVGRLRGGRPLGHADPRLAGLTWD